MAGGIGLPFQFNIKCIIFVLLLMVAYKMLPEKNSNIYDKYIPIITTLFVLAYYHLYSCKNTDKTIIILSIIIIVGILQYLYWHMPRNLFSAYFFIFFIGYIALAWFDYIMHCEIPLQAGIISFTHLFKPH